MVNIWSTYFVSLVGFVKSHVNNIGGIIATLVI
jgi:hypothetical protein